MKPCPPLRVFEHSRLLVQEPAGDQHLTATEHAALARFNDAHGGRYFAIGHRQIRTTEFVGFVSVGNRAIEILPKADRGDDGPTDVWKLALLEMLKVALGLRIDRLAPSPQALARFQLHDLIAGAFIDEVEPLMHRGLARGYRSTSDNGPVFRGRLAMAEHIRENVARADRFYVHYQTYDHAIVANQILAAALGTIARWPLAPSRAARVAAVGLAMPELPGIPITERTWAYLRPTRATARYESALRYARLILDGVGPQLQGGAERVFGLLFDMNKLWERYVAVLCRRAAPPGAHVSTQDSHPFWHPIAGGTGAASVRPDIVVREGSHEGPVRLVIDTTWKLPGGRPGIDDLKQMFVYNELLGAPRSVLLYPSTTTSMDTRGGYAGRSHECEARHVGVIEQGTWSRSSVSKQVAALLA